jgi:DNA-binding MarR family transcriptional regulator
MLLSNTERRPEPAEGERWDAERTTNELLAILPLLNRIVVTAVQREAGADTTMSQFRVLALLAAQPQTLSALARQRRVSLQSMGALVQSLVERGWIVRTPDPQDRRQHSLALSEVGRSHYEQAQAQTVRALLPFLAALSAEELRAVQLALPALHRALTRGEALDGDPNAG